MAFASAIRVSEFSRQAGINQEAIYEGLSPGGDPTLEKLAK
jgi:DNA-binding phage protein